jgi:O-6-methylguanine DNA methyltransferase
MPVTRASAEAKRTLRWAVGVALAIMLIGSLWSAPPAHAAIDAAALAGSPRAFRAAGSALGANPIPIVVPCHRVLRSSGALGGYGGGLDVKRELLTLEGVL